MPGNFAQQSATTSTERLFATKDKTVTANKTAEERKSEKPLLMKSSLLRLLAEMIRSYVGCAITVANHVYVSGISDSVTEVSVRLHLFAHGFQW